MVAYNKFNVFTENVMEGVHNLGSNTLKIALFADAALAADTVLTDQTTQTANGNGYTTGGATVTITSSAHSSGTYKLVGNDVVFTASGALSPGRYAVFYNDTPTSPADPLIGWWDYGSTPAALATGETYTVDLDPTNGILQMV